jgi:hypothetical protein
VEDEHLGVVGIDVTMESILGVLEHFNFADSFSFLTTDDLSTVAHPQLRDPNSLDNPVFPNIAYLEQEFTETQVGCFPVKQLQPTYAGTDSLAPGFQHGRRQPQS